MPISSIDGCDEQHWVDVREILEAAIDDSGFASQLVSDASDVGIIQQRIIRNLYENPMVVCDVSGKNPNVMFELGMRLAFDKPTIIVKDDKTSYSFDTSPIEHLTYPRDLRFQNIVEFKADLCAKTKGTAERVKSDKSYTTFLKHFGSFSTAELARKDLSTDEVILEELRDIRSRLSHSSQRPSESTRITGVQEAEMMRRIGMAIREFAQTNAKKTKRSMLLVRPTVIRYVEKAVNAPHHFKSAEAYYTAFDTAFDLMYSK